MLPAWRRQRGIVGSKEAVPFPTTLAASSGNGPEAATRASWPREQVRSGWEQRLIIRIDSSQAAIVRDFATVSASLADLGLRQPLLRSDRATGLPVVDVDVSSRKGGVLARSLT